MFFIGIKKILETKFRMSDEQYNRLLDTMTTPPEYTYAQTMMDEIIYQLAKLMFNQGLFIGKSWQKLRVLNTLLFINIRIFGSPVRFYLVFRYALDTVDNKIIIINGRVAGGSEAQESLQKFTDFLENEASRGRISRAMEKKILGEVIELKKTLYTI